MSIGLPFSQSPSGTLCETVALLVDAGLEVGVSVQPCHVKCDMKSTECFKEPLYKFLHCHMHQGYLSHT